MKNKTDDYLTLAAQTALSGIKRRAGGPFGAVIVKNGRVLAKAHNTVLKTNDPTRHAEINAIQKASRKRKTPFFTGAELYTTTEPCPMCFSAIHWARFKKVVWSTTISDVKKLGFNELTVSAAHMKKKGKSRVGIEQVENEECRGLLRIWGKMNGQKTY